HKILEETEIDVEPVEESRISKLKHKIIPEKKKEIDKIDEEIIPKEDEIEEGDISKTVQMTQSVIDGNYDVDEIRGELKQYDTEGTVKENLYVIYANSIIELLGERQPRSI
ncbi:hypothetical protein LCGC14_2015020, partial [marine sediment metagenome]